MKFLLLIKDLFLAAFEKRIDLPDEPTIPIVDPYPTPVIPPPPVAPPPPVPVIDPLDKLIRALTQVESEGNVYVIGDKNLLNHAYGCLQIRYGVLADVNALWKTKHVLRELLGPNGCVLSRKMCKAYLAQVLPRYLPGKRQPTQVECMRAWNGGPGAMHSPVSNPETELKLQAYVRKVQKFL